MRYWWVNQNQTHKFEVLGGFLWSPKRRSDGVRHYFYDTMAEVRRGDIVFSFYGSQIQAVGVVQQPAVTAPKPDFRSAGSNWADVGWFVEVEFAAVARPFRPADFIHEIRPLLSVKYAPLTSNGRGVQNVYLTEISRELGSLLLRLSDTSESAVEQQFTRLLESADETAIQDEIELKKLEGDVEGIQLVKARRGQGIFKANVRLVESACRITGLTDLKHLRASHIKPWAASSASEKLDGFNGLLLSPHVDHLFDRGFISFSDDGQVLRSRALNPDVLTRWHLTHATSVGAFHSSQQQYLEYHRDAVFIR